MATLSSILAWGRKESDTAEQLFMAITIEAWWWLKDQTGLDLKVLQDSHIIPTALEIMSLLPKVTAMALYWGLQFLTQLKVLDLFYSSFQET